MYLDQGTRITLILRNMGYTIIEVVAGLQVERLPGELQQVQLQE